MFYVRCRENIILHMIELKRRADADELYTSLCKLIKDLYLQATIFT